MGNSLRCCLACMLPCGALDVVRVVHLSGHVDEFTCPLAAADVLAAHPNHALTDAWSAGASRKIVILSPDSELKRGRIYFLTPSACSAPAAEKKKKKRRSRAASNKKRHGHGHHKGGAAVAASSTAEQDNYLRELLSEKRWGATGGGGAVPAPACGGRGWRASRRRSRPSSSAPRAFY